MADECEEEWPEYSSCVDRKTDSLRPAKDEGQNHIQTENLDGDINHVAGFEKVREVLERTLCLCDTTRPTATRCSPETVTVSPIKSLPEHWIWLKLVSKLNSIRQPRWTGSSLQEYYFQCLKISESANSMETSEVSVEYFAKTLFDFHGMRLFSGVSDKEDLSGGTDESSSKYGSDSDGELGNKNELENKVKLNSLDATGVLKDNLVMAKSNNTFDDLGPELEWSDNDVKDDTASCNLSSTSGFDENEAVTADLAKLSCEEIFHLRNELVEYSKQYSDVLVVELENRDANLREKELKNEFISSFLAVQAKIREASMAPSKKKFSLQSNPPSNHQSLMTTIPYEIQSGGPGPDILEKLIEILCK